MILLIVFTLFIWVILQARASRTKVWAKRFEKLAPIGRYLRADFRATRAALRPGRRKAERERAERMSLREKFNDIVSDW